MTDSLAIGFSVMGHVSGKHFHTYLSVNWFSNLHLQALCLRQGSNVQLRRTPCSLSNEYNKSGLPYSKLSSIQSLTLYRNKIAWAYYAFLNFVTMTIRNYNCIVVLSINLIFIKHTCNDTSLPKITICVIFRYYELLSYYTWNDACVVDINEVADLIIILNAQNLRLVEYKVLIDDTWVASCA